MYLIVGLGNPGTEYEGTRHNVGREIVHSLAADWRLQKKLFAEIANHSDALLALPTTYMNDSGRSVQLLVTRYGLRVTHLIILHDDIDLPLGTIRISKNASAGGHNGVQSIIDALGTKDFVRLRIGVAGITRTRTDAAAYVLKKFTKTERPMIDRALDRARDALKMILADGADAAMNEFNQK